MTFLGKTANSRDLGRVTQIKKIKAYNAIYNLKAVSDNSKEVAAARIRIHHEVNETEIKFGNILRLIE